MSEPEDDRVLLDEIKALEDVLAADEFSEASIAPKRDNLTNPPRASFPSRGFGEVTPYREPELLVNNEATCQPQSALETNRKLLDLLHESKRELMTMLEKCIENKSIVEERIKERAKNAKSSKILIGSAGMPYFKDVKQYIAPRNVDAMQKTRNGELQVVHLRYTSPWTAKDRNILWKAIRQEASSKALETEQFDGDEASNVASSSRGVGGISAAKRLNLPKNFKAMVGPIGVREFDWMKIAAMDFDNRHTPEECRVMWRVFLHPDINRYRWTKEEDTNIDKLSEKFNRQDWDSLAKELGTNRSGYQCFIRYNTNNRAMCLKDSAWSKDEDKRLKKCVEKFKIGHYVPWGTVAKYMNGRSKVQVYFRWKYNAAPHLKKGRFTEEEDATLLEAVNKHGPNFCKISTYFMPNRSSVQLSRHYLTLVQRERGIRNLWTINDDARVIKFHNKYGADWARIAEKFPEKTRTQLRHRHNSLLRYWKNGVSLYEIPRNHEETETTETKEETGLVESLELGRAEQIHSKYCKELKEVDLELLKYFQLVPPSTKPGRKPKYYKEEELEDTTRKLYILIKTLNTDLAIPEELEDRALTEKDKQLLISLQDYQQSQLAYAKSQRENLRYSRILDDETNENRELHFTPLCPGDCNKNEKFRINDRIDYESPKYLDCQIKLNLELNTPTIVVDLIGVDKSEEFDRLMEVLSVRKIEPCKPRVVRKIYVLGPEVCSKALATVAAASSPQASSIVENCQREDNATKTKKSRRVKGNTWDSSLSEGIIYQPHRAIDCVEPNYYTLLGLQHIIAGEENTAESTVSQAVVSRECTSSMEILKKRLVQLFKYPIGLSHVLRPEIYVRKVQSIGIVDFEETVEDSATVSSPPAKRKRLANKKRVSSKRKTDFLIEKVDEY